MPARDPDGWYDAVDEGDGLYGLSPAASMLAAGDAIEFRYTYAGGRRTGAQWRHARTVDELRSVQAPIGETMNLYDDRPAYRGFAERQGSPLSFRLNAAALRMGPTVKVSTAWRV